MRNHSSPASGPSNLCLKSPSLKILALLPALFCCYLSLAQTPPCPPPLNCGILERGISDKQTNPLQLIVRPNPAQDKVSIQLPEQSKGESRLEIFDIYGKLQQEMNISEGVRTVEVATAGWSNGHYFCRLAKNGQTIAISKFSIQHWSSYSFHWASLLDGTGDALYYFFPWKNYISTYLYYYMPLIQSRKNTIIYGFILLPG